MKKIFLIFAVMTWFCSWAAAGEILPGSVPGSINYQGRLERDNAPITGLIHIYFRLYNASSGGTLRWTSPELVVEAAQGIFSANITPEWDKFSRGETLYLEVQVESDVLTPREPLNSVVYAIVAKKLEDGASVSVTTLTANYQVLLATAADSKVGIGTNSPDYKLTVNGTVWLHGSDAKLCFDTGNCLVDALAATGSGGISAPGNSTIQSGTLGTGRMDFLTGNPAGDPLRMRINDSTQNGTISIGPAAITTPSAGVLDIDGVVFVSTWGVSERSGGPVPFNGDILVGGGRVTGANAEYMAIGESNNVISFVSGAAERMRVDTNGFIGVNNAAPAYPLDVTGNIHTNTGLLASAVSAGAYTGWTSAANELRAADLTHLLLQQNNSYNVGIGTNAPSEKLQVKGSIRAEKGIIAATAAFSGAVNVNGTFTANSGAGNTVNLSSTVIYGTLLVTGGIGSTAGFPAYLASTQTFTGQNTFLKQVVVSSDIATINRLGAAMKDFNFPGSRYLQVGDDKPEYEDQDTMAYLVGGSAADAKLLFYRGAAEAGRLETQGGSNLALVVGGQTKTLTDSVYHRIQNSVVWISTGYAGTPAIYVSSQMGNVGIGTVVSDPTSKLTVNGMLHIVGAGNGIIFPSGNVMVDPGSIAASALANPGDALVAANTLGAGGSVILRNNSIDGLVVDSGGNIGVGTPNPVSKMNVRGGDLVLGTPVNPYFNNGIEDLIVGGNVVFDGALIQRSAAAVQFSNLIVAGDVYFSTGTGKKTGIATDVPVTTLDVNGNAQFGQGLTKSTFTAAGVLQLATALSPVYGGTGANLSAAALGALPYFGASGIINILNSGTAGYLLQTNGAAAPTWVQATNGNTINTIVKRDGSGNFTAGTITASLTGNADTATTATNVTGGGNGSIPYQTGSGATSMLAAGTAGYLLQTNGAGAPTWAQATNGNTINTIVKRDGSGNFSAGTISANLTGDVTGSVTGNADTATTATNVTGGGNGSIPYQTGSGATSMLAAGTAGYLLQTNGAGAPTWVQATNGNTINTIVKRDGSGNFSAGTISAAFSGNLTGNVTGNADTASAMANNGTSGKVVCWRSSGVLGQCSDAPTAAGCTCVATP